jgi:hypothetical protein
VVELSQRLVRAARPALLAALVAGSVACRSEQPQDAAREQEPTENTAEKKPAVDQKIANAVAAAARESAQANDAASQGVAPPPDGIMTAEAAAKELPVGAAAAVVLGSEGASPRVKLGPDRLVAGPGPSGKLEVSYRSGSSVMPTIELELKGKVNVAEGSTPGSEPALVTRFAIGKARPSDRQPGRLPENARAEIAKLDGSSIDLLTDGKGALISGRHQLAGNNPDLEPVVMGSAEALAGAFLAYPNVPVGVGAFWMVKSRETLNGANVLAYRMVRVTELSGEMLKLSLTTRRYLLSETLPLAGFPPHRVRQFQSEGEGSVSLRVGATHPDAAEVHDKFVALVVPNDRPNQAIPVQSELEAKIAFAR